jgi:urease accessory protein UreH
MPIADRRPAAGVGRHGRLELVFAARRGRTILAHAYAEPPFRVGVTFPDGDGVHMILTTVAPGIFGGDCLCQSITVEPGARVRLTSQSALQIHPSANDASARLESTFVVEDGADLQCEWDPIIPFAGARFEQRVHVRLAEQSRFCWSDAVMAGREAYGERWAFARLAHELLVHRSDVLEYVERSRLEPHIDRPCRDWVARDACYFGTVLASGMNVESPAAAALHVAVNGFDHRVRAAADCLGSRLMLVRLMATAGISFREARARATRGAGFR